MKQVLIPSTLVSLGFCMIASCQTSPEPRVILEKAIAGLGGKEKLLKPRRGIVKAKESHGDGGDEMTVEEVFDLPKRWKRVFNSSEKGQRTATNRLVVDGEVWTWDTGGEVVQSKDDGRVNPTLQKGLALLDLASDRYKLVAIAKAKVNGKLASGFRATSEGGTADYYFDDKSGLFVQMVQKVTPKPGEELDMKYVVSDYKEIDGLQIAHRTTTYVKGGQFKDFTLVTEFTLTEVRILEKLPEDAFSLPKSK